MVKVRWSSALSPQNLSFQFQSCFSVRY